MITPLVLFQAVNFYQGFENRRAQEYNASLEVARAVAATFDAYLQDILRQGSTIGVSISSGRMAPEQANSILAASARQYPSIRDYMWTDTNGRIVASSLPSSVGQDIGDRPFLREVIQGKPWAISDLETGRFSGELAILVATGISDERGALQGALVGAIDPTKLGSVLAVARSGGGAIAIVDHRGQGVYRYPEVEMSWEQRNWLSAQRLLIPALRGEEVTGTFVSNIDGKERMTALSPIRSIGWIASANRPVEEVMAPAYRELAGQLALLAASVLIALVAAIAIGGRIVIPIRHLREHALLLARGELGHSVRVSGARELVDLASAFSLMASEIKIREERFRGAFEYAAVGVALVSLDGRFLQVNQALCRITGYSEQEMLAMTFQAITYPEDFEENLENIKALVRGRVDTYQLEKRYVHKEGHIVWVSLSASLVRDVRGEPLYMLSQVQDITDRKLAEEQRDRLHLALQELFLVDELTGLYNRRGFFTLAQQQLKVAVRNEQRPVLFFFDMDQLKEINDNYGHGEGDRAIVEAAQILKESFRLADIVARLGGDEFVALAVGNGDPQAPIERRLQNKLAARNASGDLPYRISFSIGAVGFDPHSPRDLEELIDAADRLMYEDKRTKRS